MSFPPDMDALYAAGVVIPGTAQDDLYRQWMDAMHTYAASHHSYSLPPAYHFWVVLRIPTANYSEKIVDHPTIPMMVPASGHGEFVGFAHSKAELDELTTPAVDPKTGAIREEDRRGKYVYLTYKAKIQGEHAWRAFIDFLGTHDMLEKES